MSENIEKRFFKGREIISPKEWPDELREVERKRIERDRKYTDTEEVKRKFQLENRKKDLAIIAKKFAFGELLVSEETERPQVEPDFPTILTIPERYVTNYELIQGFVPQNRLEEGIEMMFFHERLHSVGEAAKYKNDIGIKIKKEQWQLKEKIKKLQDQKEKAQGIKERLLLSIEEQQLNEEAKLILEKTSDYKEKEEIIVNRQMMKEIPSIGPIASLILIDFMLSEGLVGVRVVLNDIRKLQRKEPSSERLTEKLVEHFRKKFPHAHKQTLEKLKESYIKIGGEILENFDAWEKKNIKKQKISGV